MPKKPKVKAKEMLETPLTKLMIAEINKLEGVEVWKMSNGVDVIPEKVVKGKFHKRRFN